MGTRILVADADASVVSLIEDDRFEAAIIDINLEPVGGIPLMKQIKKRHFDMRVIITSPNDNVTDVLAALMGDASSFLVKPIDAAEMKKAITDSLREREALEWLKVEIGQEGWIELMMPSSENYLARLDHFFRLYYHHDIPPEPLEEICLCFKEIVRNSIEWAHGGDAHKKIKIGHVLFQDQFCFKIEDTGEGYDVERALGIESDLESMEDQRLDDGIRPGGLGISLVSGLMDEVITNTRGNVAILSKNI